MKAKLAYQHDSTNSPCCVGGSEEKDKTMYPCVRIPITEANKDLLEGIPMKGSATITFRTKKVEIGPSDYGPVKDEAGCIELEIHELELGKKSGEAMLNMSAADSLNEFMKEKKGKSKITVKNDDEEDEY